MGRGTLPAGAAEIAAAQESARAAEATLAASDLTPTLPAPAPAPRRAAAKLPGIGATETQATTKKGRAVRNLAARKRERDRLEERHKAERAARGAGGSK
jgi:hypothetical protein